MPTLDSTESSNKHLSQVTRNNSRQTALQKCYRILLRVQERIEGWGRNILHVTTSLTTTLDRTFIVDVTVGRNIHYRDVQEWPLMADMYRSPLAF